MDHVARRKWITLKLPPKVACTPPWPHAASLSPDSRGNLPLAMRLKSLRISNFPPISFFEVTDLADLVVFAGANGVGKSRLLQAVIDMFRGRAQGEVIFVLEATSPEEKVAWGAVVRSEDGVARGKLTAYLQRQQKRGALRSGVLNFDANRAFETVKPLSPMWEYADPLDELIAWDFTYSTARQRFEDVLYSLLRRVRHQKEELSNRALRLKEGGATHMPLDFEDPLLAFRRAFATLLPGKTLAGMDHNSQTLQYRIDGQAALLPLATLSSGEREVVTIVFDFLLRAPRDSIVIIDEPELHLHPELSYRLLRTLRDAGERNQFLLSTHSPDIISAALDDSVIFLTPGATVDGQPANQARVVREDDEMEETLRALGHSVGVIALGRKIVLIEGERSSLDKQAYEAILGDALNNLVLVPVGGKETIATFAHSLAVVLSKTIWGVEFFMLCDGDMAAGLGGHAGALEAKGRGRLRLLPRYHVENYFLDEAILAGCFRDQLSEESWLRQSSAIRDRLRAFARELLPYAVALRVTQRVRMDVGNVDLMVKGAAACVDELVGFLAARLEEESARIGSHMGKGVVEEAVRVEWKRLVDALETDSEVWKREIPGRPMLHKFANAAGIPPDRLKRLYIREASGCAAGADPFGELREIFRAFAAESGSG